MKIRKWHPFKNISQNDPLFNARIYLGSACLCHKYVVSMFNFVAKRKLQCKRRTIAYIRSLSFQPNEQKRAGFGTFAKVCKTKVFPED